MRSAAWMTAALLFCGAATPVAAGSARPACSGCNVVLITVDTLRPDHLGCYGYARPTSPHIDALAREGTVFDRFVVQSIITPVSMASLLGSRYPSRSGFTTFVSSSEASSPVLPEILRLYGLKTAAFVTSLEYYMDTVDYEGRRHPNPGFRRGFDVFSFEPVVSSRTLRDVPDEAAVERWIAGNGKTPFFLWLALGSAHWPYGLHAPPEVRGRFAPAGYRGNFARDDLYWWFPLSRIYGGRYYPVGASGSASRPASLPLADDDRAFIIGRYDAGLAYTDAFIGRIVAALDRMHLRRRTLVIVTSEHSEDLGEHGYYAHYDVYDTELRTPLILAGPGIARARRTAAAASGLDLTPTILDWLGIPLFHQAQGRSLGGVLAGEPLAPRPVFSERTPPWEHVLYQRLLQFFPARQRWQRADYARNLRPCIDEGWLDRTDVSVERGRWHLIHRRSRDYLRRCSWWGYLTASPPEIAEYELYDLESDPLEKTPILDEAAAGPLKEAVADFEAQAARWRRPAAAPVALFPYP